MDDPTIFDARRWPLHYALAWVFTRDRSFSERAKSSDFHPYLGKDDWISPEVDRAWSILHQSLVDGTVPAFFKASEPCGNHRAEEASEERIALPAAFASFDWAGHQGYRGYNADGCWRVVWWRDAWRLGGAWHFINYSDGHVPALDRIVPEAFASLDWADLTSGHHHIVVSSSAMLDSFPPEGKPVALTSDDIGRPVRPDGPGFMRLSDAAYWIATEGGTKRIVAGDVSVWREAFAKLLPRMQSGEVRVVGRRHGASLSTPINRTFFVGLRVDYPYVDTPITMIVGEEPYIKCYGAVIPDSSADQGSDELWGLDDPHVPEWSNLQADCTDIRKWWQFPEARKAIQYRANIEKQAIAALAEALKENKDLTRDEAKAFVGNRIGPRAFQNRVWPEARKLAGLDPIAPPGAKRKNRHA